MNSITQDMKYRQSLMKFAQKYGVSKASRRYNKSRSYIYFWLKRYDGTIESLACISRRPHSHPNQHTEDELTLIKNMRRRNPNLGLIEFWCRLRDRGPKPYQQMICHGQRIQVDVKHVPAYCRVGEAKHMKLYQFTAIDEFGRLRYLEGFNENSSYSAAIFLQNAVRYFKEHGFDVKCVQTDNGFEFMNRLGVAKKTCRLYSKRPPLKWVSSTN
jgi:hypothetical protein